MTATTQRPRGATVHFSGNQGTDTHGGGVRFDYVNDPVTNRKDVLGFVVGGKPHEGKLPRRAKALLQMPGEQLECRGDRIVRASVVTERVDGRERFSLGAYNGKVEDLVRMHTGLDFEQGSTANHKARLEHEGKSLYPHGFVPYDSDVRALITAESAELAELLKDPSLPVGKSSDIKLIGRKHQGGKYLSSIECSEYTDAVYYLGPRAVGFKAYIWGPIVMVRRIEGELKELPLAPTMRKLFEKLLFAQRDKQRAAIAAARAERARLHQPFDPDDASLDWNNPRT